MRFPAFFLALITGASALPVTIENGSSPVPDRPTLLGLLQNAPNADSAADLLLQHFQKHGYPAVGVEIADLHGTRRVLVDVSRFHKIFLGEGPARTKRIASDHFGHLSGAPVNQVELASVLASFHTNPLHLAVPRLQPSPDGSAVNALLKIDQSQSSRFATGYLNLGAHPLPRERFWVQGEFADLWDRNSLATARLTLAPDPANFHAAQLGSRFFQPHGSEVALSLSYSGAQATGFDAYTWQVGSQWRGSTETWHAWQLRPSLALSYRRSNNALEFGDATNRGLADVLQVTLGGTAEKQWSHGLTRASAGLVLSPFGDDREHGTLRPGARGDYGLIRTSIWHRQDLRAGWDLVLNAGGQWTSDPILQADQFALGGAAGLRGLPEQFALGDHGYLGGCELRTPVLKLPKNIALRPSLFLQAGETFDEVLETTTSAITTGVGLQLGQGDHLRVSVHAGWRLDEGGANLHSQLTWNF